MGNRLGSLISGSCLAGDVRSCVSQKFAKVFVANIRGD
jgi:hypothetical protein